MRIAPSAALAGISLLSMAAVGGCQTAEPSVRAPIAETSLAEQTSTSPELAMLPAVDDGGFVQPVAFAAQETEEVTGQPTSDRQSGDGLDVDALVAQVLAVNPDIRSAAAAWRAAAQRYPQEVSLDDPMFGFMLGPGSWGSDEVEDAYTLEASQKLPWPGKRQLRGNIAQAQANAAYYEVGEERLRIARITRLAYYQYFLAHRQLAVLKESTSLMGDFRDIARSRYESASVEQQDVLLAEVELAELQRRSLELTRQEQVARARINTLLLQPPDAPLPAPTATLSVSGLLPPADELRALALSQRPELAAQEARIRAERYAVALACKEFYPDFEVVSRYDAFWQEEPLRPMVGMNMNVPLYKQKRWAAVSEARARVAREQAQLEAQTNQLMFEVEQAYRQVEESRQTLEVYEQSLLPTARHSIDAARASYLTGRLDFLRLVESQRQLLMRQDRYYEAAAAYHERLADLQRMIGSPAQVGGAVGSDAVLAD